MGPSLKRTSVCVGVVGEETGEAEAEAEAEADADAEAEAGPDEMCRNKKWS